MALLESTNLVNDLLDIWQRENRNPTETELKVLDTYWSDHCRHTTFETALTDIKFNGLFKETLENIFEDYLGKRKFLTKVPRISQERKK